MRSRILGVSSCMSSFDFFFGVTIGEMLLQHTDNLSRTLQSANISAAEGQHVAKLTVKTISQLRNEDSFKLFWANTTAKAKSLDFGDPAIPRKRRVPRDRDWEKH